MRFEAGDVGDGMQLDKTLLSFTVFSGGSMARCQGGGGGGGSSNPKPQPLWFRAFLFLAYPGLLVRTLDGTPSPAITNESISTIFVWLFAALATESRGFLVRGHCGMFVCAWGFALFGCGFWFGVWGFKGLGNMMLPTILKVTSSRPPSAQKCLKPEHNYLLNLRLSPPPPPKKKKEDIQSQKT